MNSYTTLFSFQSELEDIIPPSDKVVKKRHRQPGYRKGDLIMNKQDILADIHYIQYGHLSIPLVQKVEAFELPRVAMPFSKAVAGHNKNVLVVFYEPDSNFARLLHAPKSYIEPLRKFKGVVGPDFSQKIGMNPFLCFENSWWNKALTAYYQSLGIPMIPNVTWSVPASYEYSFLGMPAQSVIAINCTGIKHCQASMYLWRKGYEEALRVLNPTLIIRYGDMMPGEDESRSVYFENINLKNLRHGS